MIWFRAALAALLLVHWCAWGQQPIRLKARGGASIRPGIVRGRHFIIQFAAFPGEDDREDLVRRGIRVLQYVPENALMVSAGPAADLGKLQVTWSASLEAADKISPLFNQQISGAILAIFHADVDILRQREIVRLLGFDIVANRGLLPNELVLVGPLARLIALASFDEVSYLLPASPDLAAGVPVAGCGGAVTEAGPIGEYVLVGTGWPKDSSGKVALQYFIRSLTEKLDPGIARSEITRALQEWTKYAPVSISPGQQGAARTIDIQFARGAHGDAYPFLGLGSLAHTFYPAPPNSEPVAGDMHLNGDEPWHTGSSVDLFSVVLHETGHALGLGHSDRPGAVMYPYYHQAAGLSDDDIAGLRALYGAGTAPPPNPPGSGTPIQPPGNSGNPGGSGNPSPGSGSGSLALEVVSPPFTIVSTTSSTIAMSGTASGPVAAVKWSTSVGESGTASGTMSWSATVPLLTGTNTVTVRAYDAAGNSVWRSVTVVRH